jgi:hypothetical protein
MERLELTSLEVTSVPSTIVALCIWRMGAHQIAGGTVVLEVPLKMVSGRGDHRLEGDMVAQALQPTNQSPLHYLPLPFVEIASPHFSVGFLKNRRPVMRICLTWQLYTPCSIAELCL